MFGSLKFWFYVFKMVPVVEILKMWYFIIFDGKAIIYLNY